MSIKYLSEGIAKPKLRYSIVSLWIKNVLKLENHQSGILSYIFCNDDYLYNINKQFLSHDYYTDIITFDYSEKNMVSGDMFISIERVKENSLLYNCSYNDEILRVMIHGLLHLLGYNDSNEIEKELMRKMEDEYVLMFKEIDNANSK